MSADLAIRYAYADTRMWSNQLPLAIKVKVDPMRLYVTCHQCLNDSEAPGSVAVFAKVIYNESGIYPYTCLKGHQGCTILQSFKYEVLSEVGFTALALENTFEAVAAFHAALERFYHFGIEMALAYTGNLEKAEGIRSALGKSSEREFGAYVLASVIAFGTVPPVLNSNLRGFRNNVVHNGQIPTMDEAIKEGVNTTNVIREGVGIIRRHAHSLAAERLMDQVRERMQAARNQGFTPEGPYIGKSFASPVFNSSEAHDLNFEDYLEQTRKHHRLISSTFYPG
ncbi:hypothetical protein [Xanthomonas sp. 3058]|uniref:hypothetical protein n=1 Tax=Xanthomonas sp. 3058 TaxID=3035314 RepID=UPI001614CC8A|nr:hypothetical protein [Xanthomonas sp. 3058]MBB5866082.1 hypothetical protein [Xanthomonas sp. 3058]